MSDSPGIVVICGSSELCDIMAVCAWLIEKEEGKIAMGLHLLPSWYQNVPSGHLAEHEGVADQMDELHLRKIELADEIFVVNYKCYIGESTAKEISHAANLGKRIRYYSFDPIGKRVDCMITKVFDLKGGLNDQATSLGIA